MIKHDEKLLTFDQPLEAGNYILPFEFDLPEFIPGSVAHYDFRNKKKEDFFIRYTVKCIINTNDNKKLSYK